MRSVELQPTVLLPSVGAVAAISVYQELRAQRVLKALRDPFRPRSTVVRGGLVQRFASQALVESDCQIVQDGDRRACDATLLDVDAMRVDESLLTGESVPADKAVADDDGGLLCAGTLVVRGDGVARVTATGVHTTLGRICSSPAALAPRSSPPHEELRCVVSAVALIAPLSTQKSNWS